MRTADHGMTYATLGGTGLRASVVGLGCGGHSRLGQATGGSVEESVAVVRRALELGVNFIDTAESYGTEEIVGQAIAGRRDEAILSTKKSMTADGGRAVGPEEVVRGLEASLKRLGTDHVDIYHCHGVSAEQYPHVCEHLVPALLKLREQGKVRFLGITEAFGGDTTHRMLTRAVQDDWIDVLMVGFNILNQSARERVLLACIAKNIGVLDMFAVRDALSRPDNLRQTVAALVQQGLVDGAGLDPDAPLGFLLESGAAASLPDAAYRFCRAEPGIHVVLSGTGSVAHLEANVASVLRPPLPREVRERLVRLFQRVDTVSGQ